MNKAAITIIGIFGSLPARPGMAADCPGPQCQPPPPVQREAPAQAAQRQAATIAEENRVMAPLANGVTTAACAAALANAKAAARPDLAQVIKITCTGR